jgi:tellurite resistance protein
MGTTSLAELLPEEGLALVGLVKMVIQADKRFTLKESAALQQLAEQMGRRTFNQLVDEARRRFPTLDALRAHVATVERPEARELIYRTATAMADADAVRTSEETAVLQWVAKLWGLES